MSIPLQNISIVRVSSHIHTMDFASLRNFPERDKLLLDFDTFQRFEVPSSVVFQ